MNLWIIYYFKQHKKDRGLTLIELLVVIIIISILGTLAIPSVLNQVGKARESEATVNLGALNRAQQAYFVEKGAFVDVGQISLLNVPITNSTYFTFSTVDEAVQQAIGNDNGINGTKDHLGALQFSYDTATFRGIICRATNAATAYTLSSTDVVNPGVTLSSNVIGCNSSNAAEVK